uniref:Uncharacterized protein n=1 Tax=Lotharella globosa TaxID=91324 RepID=A0A7S3ZA27_9EUKA|mmetsp:Transcript_16118/g.32659  ORF Transcript_16118/g.32659 Transcript_16118/m.32659 type:complete len:432 (+) Transcript_16118:76-1371(+)
MVPPNAAMIVLALFAVEAFMALFQLVRRTHSSHHRVAWWILLVTRLLESIHCMELLDVIDLKDHHPFIIHNTCHLYIIYTWPILVEAIVGKGALRAIRRYWGASRRWTITFFISAIILAVSTIVQFTNGSNVSEYGIISAKLIALVFYDTPAVLSVCVQLCALACKPFNWETIREFIVLSTTAVVALTAIVIYYIPDLEWHRGDGDVHRRRFFEEIAFIFAAPLLMWSLWSTKARGVSQSPVRMRRFSPARIRPRMSSSNSEGSQKHIPKMRASSPARIGRSRSPRSESKDDGDCDSRPTPMTIPSSRTERSSSLNIPTIHLSSSPCIGPSLILRFETNGKDAEDRASTMSPSSEFEGPSFPNSPTAPVGHPRPEIKVADSDLSTATGGSFSLNISPTCSSLPACVGQSITPRSETAIVEDRSPHSDPTET